MIADEFFHFGTLVDSAGKGLPFAREAERIARTDPRRALEFAKRAYDAAPTAWLGWWQAFSYNVGRLARSV